MKTKIAILILILGSKADLKAQQIKYFDYNNMVELSIYKVDSLAFIHKIKNAKLFYIEDNNKSAKLIENIEFQHGGLINKMISYNYSKFVDSIVIDVGERLNQSFFLKAKIGPKYTFDKLTFSNSLFSRLPDYRSYLDSNNDGKFHLIERHYSKLSDSVYQVNTLINNKEYEKSNVLVPTSPGLDIYAIDYNKNIPDTVLIKDSMIINFHTKDNFGNTIIKRESFFHKNLVKQEYFTYGKNKEVVSYSICNTSYDKMNRAVYYDECVRDNGTLVKILVKTFSFKGDGNRIETIDKNGADGKIDESWEYNDKNLLISNVKYFIEYNPQTKVGETQSVEFKFEYNDKGLLIRESVYQNGIFQNEKNIVYSYFN